MPSQSFRSNSQRRAYFAKLNRGQRVIITDGYPISGHVVSSNQRSARVKIISATGTGTQVIRVERTNLRRV